MCDYRFDWVLEILTQVNKAADVVAFREKRRSDENKLKSKAETKARQDERYGGAVRCHTCRIYPLGERSPRAVNSDVEKDSGNTRST